MPTTPLLPADAPAVAGSPDLLFDLPASPDEARRLLGALGRKLTALQGARHTFTTSAGEVTWRCAVGEVDGVRFVYEVFDGTVEFRGAPARLGGSKLYDAAAGDLLTGWDAAAAVTDVAFDVRQHEDGEALSALVDAAAALIATQHPHLEDDPAFTWRFGWNWSLNEALCVLAALSLPDPAARRWARQFAEEWTATPRDLVESVSAALL